MVSHDWAFLDAVATRTYEPERGKLEHYSGNYSAAMTEKVVWLESAKIAYQSAMDKKRALERWKVTSSASIFPKNHSSGVN